MVISYLQQCLTIRIAIRIKTNILREEYKSLPADLALVFTVSLDDVGRLSEVFETLNEFT